MRTSASCGPRWRREIPPPPSPPPAASAPREVSPAEAAALARQGAATLLDLEKQRHQMEVTARAPECAPECV